MQFKIKKEKKIQLAKYNYLEVELIINQFSTSYESVKHNLLNNNERDIKLFRNVVEPI